MAEDNSTIFTVFYEDNEVRVSGKNISALFFFPEFFLVWKIMFSPYKLRFSVDSLIIFSVKNPHHI